MARHNRDGRGSDQRGETYEVSYQPDWLRLVKITRALESGRQSTKTLFRNLAKREQPPGQKVRTRLAAEACDVEFAIELDDPKGVVRRIIVETVAPGSDERLVFSIDGRAPSRRKGS